MELRLLVLAREAPPGLTIVPDVHALVAQRRYAGQVLLVNLLRLLSHHQRGHLNGRLRGPWVTHLQRQLVAADEAVHLLHALAMRDLEGHLGARIELESSSKSTAFDLFRPLPEPLTGH